MQTKMVLIGVSVCLLTVTQASHTQMGDVKEAERRAALGRFKALQQDVKKRIALVEAKVREIERTTDAIVALQKENRKAKITTCCAANLNNMPRNLPSAVTYVLGHAFRPIVTSNPANPTQDMVNLGLLDRYAREAQVAANAENARRLRILEQEREEARKIRQLAKRSF
ncbi:MAG: hypothetical protein ACREXY_27390 [Gammaproteobacteria bacterium]